MLTLLDLPNEILHSVCRYLAPDPPHPLVPCDGRDASLTPPSRGRGAVSRLSRTCRELRDVAQPELFRTVALHDEEGYDFILTVLRRPTLAQRVERLYIRQMCTLPLLTPPPPGEVLRIRQEPPELEPAMQGICEDATELWLDLLHCPLIEWSWGAVLALLLALLPSLKDLDIPWASSTGDALRELGLAPARWFPSRNSLERLTIRQVEDSPCSFGLDSGILSWPNLRSLRLENCVFVTLRELGPLSNAPLEHLGLRACIMPKKVLQAMIRQCKEVESFSFVDNWFCQGVQVYGNLAEYPYSWQDARPGLTVTQGAPVYPGELLPELLVYRTSLKRLVLDFSNIIRFEKEDHEELPHHLRADDRYLRPLRMFGSLQKLEINQHALRETGNFSDDNDIESDSDSDSDSNSDVEDDVTDFVLAQLLPTSIRTVKLTYMKQNTMPVFKYFAAWVSRFPSLTRLEVEEVFDEEDGTGIQPLEHHFPGYTRPPVAAGLQHLHLVVNLQDCRYDDKDDSDSDSSGIGVD